MNIWNLLFANINYFIVCQSATNENWWEGLCALELANKQLSSLEMDTLNRVQNLIEAVFSSHNTNTLEKTFNPTFLSASLLWVNSRADYVI